MNKDDVLRILMNGATKPQDDLNDYTKGKSNGMAEAYSHAWTLVKKLNIDDVSGTVGLEDAKKVLLRYDQAIKEEIAVKLEWLRDHGTHAEFCDIITDIRENVLDTYR